MGKVVAEVPLAEDAGRVTSALEHLREGRRLECEPLAFKDRVRDPVLELVPPGQQRGPGRRTRRTDVEVGEPHPLRVKSVEVRRLQGRVAVSRDVTVPLIVGQHEHDVRLLARERFGGGRPAERGGQCGEEQCGGAHGAPGVVKRSARLLRGARHRRKGRQRRGARAAPCARRPLGINVLRRGTAFAQSVSLGTLGRHLDVPCVNYESRDVALGRGRTGGTRRNDPGIVARPDEGPP